MPVHPQCQAVLDAAAANGTAFDAGDPVEARVRYDAGTAAFAPPTPPLDHVVEDMLDGPVGPLPIRAYRPRTAAAGPLPVTVFFHGGGWVFGNIDSHDHMCRLLAHGSGSLVVSVDYRLAPEARFPAAFDDCLAATKHILEHADQLGGDPARVAVAGDSAGGNLAAAVCLALRDACGQQPLFQFLIYPAVDLACDSASHLALGEGYLLTAQGIDFCTASYLGADRADVGDWRASPLKAETLAGLPPALVQTAEFDPLKDEGAAYAQALSEAGVPATHTVYDGMIHGFMRMGAVVDAAADAIDEGAAALKRAFAT
jgi:acetyl esterase